FVENGLRQALAVEFVEPGFRGEKIELRGSTLHKDKNAGFCLRLAVPRGLEKGGGVGCRGGVENSVVREHGTESYPPESTGGGGEELAAGALDAGLKVHHSG